MLKCQCQPSTNQTNHLPTLAQRMIAISDVTFQWDDDKVRFVLDQRAELDFIVLAHWNNSPRIDMSLHSDTLFLFWANRYL